ncbi:MAG: tRNA 2-thiouridine(34) synthase MnmA [Syntrophomonadaceae bacterium]|jgi:tRNA-specific 2-thiouridylase
MKIAVLMSGGVDSTVAALLLKKQGYQVIGLTMINWNPKVANMAQQAASQLGIEHIVVDFSRQFATQVINNFRAEYEKGHTPNPCVRCNRYIKFGLLLEYALNMGFDRVATGHYARIEYDETRKRFLLKKAKYLAKDQSYFLFALNQEQLGHTIFPLGEISKPEVRQLAREHNITAAASKESQEICFIEGDYRKFLLQKKQYTPGKITDLQGNILGLHKGLPFYTIGQRKGLGISGGKPLYVVALDSEKNRVILDDQRYLFARTLTAIDNNFIYYEEVGQSLRVQARIRYRAKDAPALLSVKGDKVILDFDDDQRAITPGQAVVYYLGDYVLGGGTIKDQGDGSCGANSR